VTFESPLGRPTILFCDPSVFPGGVMGDNFTQPAKPAELLRARLLREALERGATLLSRVADYPVEAEATPDFDPESVEVQKAYLEELLECTPEALSILSEFTVQRINSEFTRLFGYTSKEAVGRRIDELIVPPDRTSETRWIVEMLSRG